MKTTCNVIEYLNKNQIAWFPVDLAIETDTKTGKTTKKPTHTGYYMPKMTDFSSLTSEEICERQKIVDEFPHIAIDTRVINHLDVDTNEWDDTPFLISMKEELPHFLSATKRLPHIFCKLAKPIMENRIQLTDYEGIEVLSGQWSFCRTDAIVNNCNAEIRQLVTSPQPSSARRAPYCTSMAPGILFLRILCNLRWIHQRSIEEMRLGSP